MINHRGAEPIRLVAVEERHLEPVRFVEEAVHGGQHHGHGELIRVDEVQGFGHGDEDLVVDAVGHSVLSHKVQHGEFVLVVDEILALDEHGDERRRGLELLAEGEHLLVE